MGNRKGRTRAYELEYADKLISLMAKGKFKCEACKEFDIAESTFDRWVETIPEFKAAYEIGQTFKEAHWVAYARKVLEGEVTKVKEKLLTKFLEVAAKEFKPVTTQTGFQTTNISIQNMQVLNQLDRSKLIRRVSDLINRNSDVIDVNPIESEQAGILIESDPGTISKTNE